MDSAIALVCLLSMAFVVGFSLLSLIASSGKHDDTNEALSIQKERNQIMREAIRVRKAEIMLKYQQQSQQQPTQIEEKPQGIILRRGEKHTYQRQRPPVENFPDDQALQKRQADQDARIEKIKKERRL